MPECKLFLIDAHALCYRSFFAIKGLATSYGQPTNAVYGFLNTLKKILREHKPEYLAVCFDVGKKTFRQERFAKYKIHRPKMPDDLISQIPLIKEVVLAYNLPVFELEGFEADDVIATITKKVSKNNLEVVIVSGDKDMLQLVNDKVHVFDSRKDRILGPQETEETLGIAPKNITDFIGLAGDSTDNIPGVSGIGEVTAKGLINQFGDLENILANVENISSKKVKEKLIEQKEQAVFSKELATLDADAPIEFKLNDVRLGAPDSQRLFELFKKLEFKKLADEISAEVQPSPAQPAANVVKTDSEAKRLITQIQQAGRFIFVMDHVSTEDSLFDQVAISIKDQTVYQFAEKHFILLKEIFEDNRIEKVTHDVKEAMKILIKKDIVVEGKIFDVMLAGYLLSPALGSYSLEALGWEYLKVSSSANSSLEAKTVLTSQLFSVLQTELEEKSLLKLFEEIEIPLAHVLFTLETQGVHIDTALLEQLSRDAQKRIDGMVKELYQLAGMEFNLNSPKQLSQVLFEKLKLPVVKKTKTGFSTDEGVLVKLSQSHPLPALILEYRQLTKLKSTYFDVLPKLTDPKTGRLHATFNQTGTETGRLSSNNPNLQNIPIRTELGRQIRKGFIARNKEYILVSADYSQIELRILAHLSQDENLIRAFKNNEDIHAFTAALIFEVKEDAVTPEMRDTAKRVNFGILYGMSAFGLSKDLNISNEAAQEFIDKYFLRYPKVKNFIDQQIKRAEEQGYVLTILNRRRYLPEIKSSNMAIRQFAQRQAVNTPVQGAAADLMKLAMINIQKEVENKTLDSKMIITVHDELVFDVPKKEKTVMVDLIRDKMEHPIELIVPIKTSIKAGQNWLEMEKIPGKIG